MNKELCKSLVMYRNISGEHFEALELKRMIYQHFPTLDFLDVYNKVSSLGKLSRSNILKVLYKVLFDEEYEVESTSSGFIDLIMNYYNEQIRRPLFVDSGWLL